MRHIGIPLGIWLTFRHDMGLHGLWYGLTLALIGVSVVGVWIGLKTDWDQEVQKVQKRLEADKGCEDEHRANNSAGDSA
jgi:MATE family multidrug resistance protein